jgi:hypothetical protein
LAVLGNVQDGDMVMKVDCLRDSLVVMLSEFLKKTFITVRPYVSLHLRHLIPLILFLVLRLAKRLCRRKDEMWLSRDVFSQRKEEVSLSLRLYYTIVIFASTNLAFETLKWNL